MRIIGGARGGRRLVEWEASGIRPMRDFVRTALFNIIEDFVPDAAFLDLFSGTGSVGLEALSRGARSCTFVDRSADACRIVRRNLDALDLLPSAEVIEGDWSDALDRLSRVGRRFDLVFLGPPYFHDLVPATLDRLADGRLLSDDPVVIAEIHATEPWRDVHGLLGLASRRRHGDNQLLFYRPTDEPASGGKEVPRS